MTKKLPFHQRFSISLDTQEAHKRFVNRVYQAMFTDLIPARGPREQAIVGTIGAELGTSPARTRNVRDFIQDDFVNCMRAIEVFYEYQSADPLERGMSPMDIDRWVKKIISNAEGDIGVEWRDGQFWRSGAKILDEKLVNENLKWLQEFPTIYEPFENALRAYLESVKDPGRHEDVVQKMYKALEATTKVVLRNDKDLSENRERFIKSLSLTKWHSQMLKEYIDYANELARHARDEGKPKVEIKEFDAENFIYLTGLFIRYALKRLKGRARSDPAPNLASEG